MDNIPVIAQRPGRPDTRRQVGVITSGEKPDQYDWQLWGLDGDSIVSMKTTQIGTPRQSVLLIITPEV